MIPRPVSKDLSKMAMAAEELIKAASSHVEAANLSIGKESLDCLKELTIGSSSIEKSIESMKTSMDSKINTLDQSISNLTEEVSELKEEVSELKEELALQSKNQKLEWAFSNAGYKSFKYYYKNNSQQIDSKNLVQGILISFRQGKGNYTCDHSMTPYFGNQKVEKGEKQFRDALSDQINDLIGHMPRITLEDNGYVIYYS